MMRAVYNAVAGTRTASASKTSSRARPCSLLERMPKWLICVPLTIQWLWLSLRYRSFTLPSAANPAITSGGLVGEGKLEYFRGMGARALAATAAHCAVSTQKNLSITMLRQRMANASLSFPLIAKPDLGLCGYGVRLITNMQELRTYLSAFPKDEVVVLQAYLPQPHEAGIFYARHPDTGCGSVIGLAFRDYPRVIGDGIHTIAELITADPRAQRLAGSRQHECTIDCTRLPAKGEVVRLATIGSTRVGGVYHDGRASITAQLTAAVDAIAREMPAFHFGRFDVRFDSLEDLKNGANFTIMEINGAGSEAIQAWDPHIGVLEGFRIIFEKQRILFAIGAAMRRRGAQTIGLFELARLNRRQQKLIARYPPSN